MSASLTTDLEELVAGAVDMHCHFGPDAHLQRSVDSVDAVRLARDAKMAGVVLKSHDFPTASLAYALEKLTPGIRVIGGICLDPPVGGINPEAMEVMCRTGGKVVWFPTLSSENDHRKLGIAGAGLSIVDATFHREPRVKPEVMEILALAKEYDVVVETGHISFPEIMSLLGAAEDLGVTKIVVTHATEQLAGPQLDIPQMLEVAARGAYLEHCALTCYGQLARETPEDIANAIRAVGARSCILSTDYGQAVNLPPAQGMQVFLGLLAAEGISEADLALMAKENPKNLLSMV
jgi:hypothetical protein